MCVFTKIWPLVLMLVTSGQAFLFDTDSSGTCPVTSPCACVAGSINCQHANLNALPEFLNVTSSFSLSGIQLNGNNISLIPNMAFEGLTNASLGQLKILLQDNKISDIDKQAFFGIALSITSIDLDNNFLTTIPEGLRMLPNLTDLSIRNNPLTHVTYEVMHDIGRSLETLKIGNFNFSHWPVEFRLLRNLKSLEIIGIKFDHLPADAFHGFDHTLTSLEIDNSTLTTIPHAVCNLRGLRSFEFSNNHHLNVGRNLFEPCPTPLIYVKYVFLQHDGLTTIPNIFSSFPNMDVLYASYNSIIYIDDSTIPENSTLSEFYLDRNKLRQIPTALGKLQHLTILDLSDNEITTIEGDTLTKIKSLRRLILASNPIVYVSSSSFEGLRYMVMLDLGYTNLTTIPEAVKSLDNLRVFQMAPSGVECSCVLDWIKKWSVYKIVFISGHCEYSTETIQNYVRNSLSSCP